MDKKVRSKSNWIMALQLWNKKYNSGSFLMPKKGTPEYDQVKEIQSKLEYKVSKKLPVKRGRPKKQDGEGLVKLVRKGKNEFDENVKLYNRTKRNIKDANSTYEATKQLQRDTINNLKRGNSMMNKFNGRGQRGMGLQKALNFATNQPDKFVEFINKMAQQGGGVGKKQHGGFLPAFLIPFIPAIRTALGAFATGAAGAAGAAAVDA